MMSIRILRKYPFFILALFFGGLFTAKFFGVTINISPSMKEGIYIKTQGEVKRGDIVAACLSDPYKALGLKSLYIEKGSKCDGVDPVIKKIIAVPGDDVVLAKDYIIVNNVRFPFKTETRDSAGRILDIYPRGTYLQTKGYWLIGTNSPNSWDSRYWGLIKKEQILYGLRPMWV